MKHNYKTNMACAIIAAAIACPAIATVNKSDNGKAIKTTTVYSYGDYMTGADVLTGKLVSFYNGNNSLLRQIYLDNTETLQKYYTYEYNDKGLLALSYSRFLTIQENGLEGFNAPDDSTTYEYDEQGRLVYQHGQQAYKYTYDADGNTTSKEELIADWDSDDLVRNYILTYSDFIAPNCPQKLESKGRYESYNYVGELTYNKQNKLLSEKDYTVDENGEKTFLKSTTNAYDSEGNLLSTVRHEMRAVYDNTTWELIGNQITPIDSIVYSKDGDLTKQVTYTYNSYADDGQFWNKSLSYTVTEERELDGALASNVTVEAVDGKLNTNKITVTAPENAKSGYSFYLYRDGKKIATLTPDSEMSFTDEQVFNDTHDYFAQTVKNDDEKTGYNISDVATIKNYTELPAPTNVRGIGKKNESLEGAADGTSMYVAWDAPKYSEEMGFMGYNVMDHNEWYDGVANDGLVDGLTCGIDMYNYYTEKNIYVQAVYKLGYANSDIVNIKMDDLPLLGTDGIGSVNSPAGRLNYANGVISLDDAANICVMDMSGKKLCTANNAKSISIENMPNGVYLVSVMNAGKATIVKVRK